MQIECESRTVCSNISSMHLTHLNRFLAANLLLQPKAEQFNCAQRAHSNFLENATQTMLFILVAGLKYPNAATIIGGAWLISRAAFLYGYVYSGKPQGRGRHLGSTFWLCQGALWALTVFGFARDLINIRSVKF
jgi:glutathione S-transferase